MDKKLNNEKLYLKISSKRDHFFQKNVLYNKPYKKPNNSLNTKNNNIEDKFKNLTNNFLKKNNGENTTSFNYFKFNNKLLREAISLNSYKEKDRKICYIIYKKNNIKKRLKLLEKDIDLYSPEYQRLSSTHNLATKKKYFSLKQNMTYEKNIQKNINNFLFSEPKNTCKKSMLLDKKSFNNFKIKKICKNLFNSKNETINNNKFKINCQKRPKTSIKKYKIIKNNNRINYIFKKGIDEKNYLNTNDILKINFINFSLELNNISKRNKDIKNRFKKNISPRDFCPKSARNITFYKNVDSYRNRANISLIKNIGKK